MVQGVSLNLIVAKPFKKLPKIHRITQHNHSILSQLNPVHTQNTPFLYGIFNIIVLCVPRSFPSLEVS
jgi:hypothetical protein